MRRALIHVMATAVCCNLTVWWAMHGVWTGMRKGSSLKEKKLYVGPVQKKVCSPKGMCLWDSLLSLRINKTLTCDAMDWKFEMVCLHNLIRELKERFVCWFLRQFRCSTWANLKADDANKQLIELPFFFKKKLI
jgi:hypothetical protein